MKKILSSSLKIHFLLTACILLSGCELFDLIEKAVMNNGRRSYGKTYVTILVMPPFPDKIEGTDAIQKSFTFSKSVERGLLEGLAQYNSQSSSTHVNHVYWNDAKTVLGFYRKVLSGGNIRALCEEQLSILRNQYDKKDASCVICGVYSYSEYASSTQVQLIYYDAAKRQNTNQTGNIPIKEGRDKESKLADLMTNLLKKVYR